MAGNSWYRRGVFNYGVFDPYFATDTFIIGRKNWIAWTFYLGHVLGSGKVDQGWLTENFGKTGGGFLLVVGRHVLRLLNDGLQKNENAVWIIMKLNF